QLKTRALNYCLLTRTLRRHLTISRITLAQHKMIIFYGPPGTGKTTLARGLANEFARELDKKGKIPVYYAEIDAQRLSSMWLGEGPKRVKETFDQLHQISLKGYPLICLIDEVESLLTNRALTLNDSNPVDVFRGVNTMLQQIDQIAERHNVFTIATSNLPKAI